MKKALSLLVSCLMLVSLVSCAAGKNSKHTAKTLAGCSEQDGTDLLFYYYEKDGGGAVLDVCTGKNGSNIIQIISLEKSGEYYIELDYELSFEGISFDDMNFDGHPDLYLPLSAVTENLQGMAWLWNVDKEQYILSDSLSKITELRTDEGKKCIYGCDYSNGGEQRSVYTWNGSKLIRRDAD